MSDLKELHAKLRAECARVHPTYTEEQINQWAGFSARHHVNRVRKQKVMTVVPWQSVLLWLYRAGVLILLSEILQCLHLKLT